MIQDGERVARRTRQARRPSRGAKPGERRIMFQNPIARVEGEGKGAIGNRRVEEGNAPPGHLTPFPYAGTNRIRCEGYDLSLLRETGRSGFHVAEGRVCSVWETRGRPGAGEDTPNGVFKVCQCGMNVKKGRHGLIHGRLHGRIHPDPRELLYGWLKKPHDLEDYV